MINLTVKVALKGLYKTLSIVIIATSLVACGGSDGTLNSDDNTSSIPVTDTTPDIFSFINQVNMPFFDIVESNSVTISGVDDASAISIVGGEYAIDGGPFTVNSGSIILGQSVKLRVTAADSFNTTRTATLTAA